MAIATYAELVTAIADWMARDDLGDYVDSFIALTEEMHRRPPSHPNDIKLGGIRLNKTRTTSTFTAGTSTQALPTDFLELDSLYLSTYHPLEFVSPDQLRAKFREGTGRPKFFTLSDVIELDVALDSAYSYEISYLPKMTGLSSSNTTNALLTAFPLAYLSGCLMHASRFVRDDDGAAAWAMQYKDAAWMASETYRRGRVSQGPISIKSHAYTP